MIMDPLIGAALITGGTGLMGSLFSSSAAQQSYADSSRLMSQQYAYQKEMQERQQEMWKEQFNLVNDYNDPSAAIQRYLRAGISPSAAFGGSTVGQSSATPSMVQGGQPVPYPPTLMNDAQMFSTIAQALSSLGSAFKNTAEGRSISSMLAEQVRGMKMSNDQQEFRNALERSTLPDRVKKELGKLDAERLKLVQDVQTATQDELLKMEQRFKVIQERINEITKGEILVKENNNWVNNFNSVLNLRRSQMASNYGMANQSNAIGRREDFFNQLRADPDARQSLLNEIKMQGALAVKRGDLTDAQFAKLMEETELLTKTNDIYIFEKAWSHAMEYGNFLVNAIGHIGSLAR